MYMHERGLLMMIEQLWGSPDIFRILVPLPENPLKGLNVYVLRTKEQALVIYRLSQVRVQESLVGWEQ